MWIGRRPDQPLGPESSKLSRYGRRAGRPAAPPRTILVEFGDLNTSCRARESECVGTQVEAERRRDTLVDRVDLRLKSIKVGASCLYPAGPNVRLVNCCSFCAPGPRQITTLSVQEQFQFKFYFPRFRIVNHLKLADLRS